MAFDPKAFAARLNADQHLQEEFLTNPQKVLAAEGLTITPAEADAITHSVPATSGGSKPNFILPIVIGRF